jgi:hypothetical protein
MMDPWADLEITLRRVLEALAGLEIRFHCTGGLVAGSYGEPRFTQDVDIVMGLTGEAAQTRLLIEALGSHFLVDRDEVEKAIGRQDMFQALDLETFIKIDFHVGEAVPGELGRSVIRELFPGLSAPLVSREDAIISKLLWIKKGSVKSRRDVIMMLRRGEPLDREALERRARELDVIDLLFEIQSALWENNGEP